MLGNLHVRFGVGAGVKLPGLHHNAVDLKAGSKIRVTTKKDDRNVATAIESLDKHAEFAKCSS